MEATILNIEFTSCKFWKANKILNFIPKSEFFSAEDIDSIKM